MVRSEMATAPKVVDKLVRAIRRTDGDGRNAVAAVGLERHC